MEIKSVNVNGGYDDNKFERVHLIVLLVVSKKKPTLKVL